jgi:hypothetical protein
MPGMTKPDMRMPVCIGAYPSESMDLSARGRFETIGFMLAGHERLADPSLTPRSLRQMLELLAGKSKNYFPREAAVADFGKEREKAPAFDIRGFPPHWETMETRRCI